MTLILTNDIGGKHIEEFKHLYSSKTLETTKSVFVSTRFIQEAYGSEKELRMIQRLENSNEGLKVEEKIFHIIGHTGTHELNKWKYQNEIKLIATLMSAKPIDIEICKYLLIPIKFDCVNDLLVTLKGDISSELKEKLEYELNKLVGDRFRIEQMDDFNE